MSDNTQIEKVTYKTFVNDLYTDQVSKVDLYSYGSDFMSHPTIDFTYQTKEGHFRGVKMPLTASENSLLIHSLEGKTVEYVSHGESYPGEVDDDMGSMILVSSMFFILPLLLVCIIFYQVRVISKLSFKLADLRLRTNETEPSTTEQCAPE